jgi:hypothetical protein
MKTIMGRGVLLLASASKTLSNARKPPNKGQRELEEKEK